MSRLLNRRRWLHMGAGGLGYLFTGPALSVARAAGANDRLRVAGIGVGGKGSGDIDQAGELMEVVALVDIDDLALGKKANRWPQAKTFHDFRKLFDDSALVKHLDAVTVATPDHTHALATALALKAGKHVYTQKPLTRTVAEARLLRDLARTARVCTQMGNQGTADNGLRRAIEIIRAGTIGGVTEVHAWTNRPIWPQAPVVMTRPPEAPVPSHVHWEEWLGPAPARPYAVYTDPNLSARGRGAYHAFNWRGWWDFGTGAIGDMACHAANMAFHALHLGLPTRVSAEAGDVNPETCPSYAHVVMEFPARGDLPPVTFHWYEGAKAGQKLMPPREWVEKIHAILPSAKPARELASTGSILIGTKGFAYFPHGGSSRIILGPAKEFVGVQTETPETLPSNGKGDQGHKEEWVAAIRAGKPDMALANFEFGSQLTESFLLGNVAIRAQSAFDYDGATGTVRGNPSAQQYLAADSRKGWELPV